MEFETIIIGAGAAGMMCAAHSGGRSLVIDHAKAPGEKIRISGGGRCNFTNLDTKPENFLSNNPHFCKSALKRYTQWDFISLMDQHSIAWHEKTLGQLFCDGSAKQVVEMLRRELERADAQLWLLTSLKSVSHDGEMFHFSVEREGQVLALRARNLVLASGGKSIPKMGASGLSYEIAAQFGLDVTPVPMAARLKKRPCLPIAGSLVLRFCKLRLIGAKGTRLFWILIRLARCLRLCEKRAKSKASAM